MSQIEQFSGYFYGESLNKFFCKVFIWQNYKNSISIFLIFQFSVSFCSWHRQKIEDNQFVRSFVRLRYYLEKLFEKDSLKKQT